jgi:hypothetical protein
MAHNHFLAMLASIRATFPELDDGAVRYAANLVSNELRRGHCDIYNVKFSRVPLDDAGYYVDFVVEASGVPIYARVTVD